MALIKCPECGREISDKAFSCPYCGFPIKHSETTNDNIEEAQEHDVYPQIPPKPINSKKHETIVGAIIIFLLMFTVVWKLKEVADNREVSIEEESMSIVDFSESVIENTEESEMQTSSEYIPDESKEAFIASCQEISYKTLARTPDEHIGQRIVLTIKISQIMQGGWFDNNEYYRVYTNDEYDMWMGDEYFMYDSRIEDSTKILKDDVWKVYAEFIGTETVTRALSGTKEDVPAIRVYYAELISE